MSQRPPSGAKATLAGLMSPWTMPSACNRATARATWAPAPRAAASLSATGLGQEVGEGAGGPGGDDLGTGAVDEGHDAGALDEPEHGALPSSFPLRWDGSCDVGRSRR